MKIPMQMTESDFLAAVDADQGICLSCGAYQDCCEPDAREYDCEECGEDRVFGMEQALIEGLIEFRTEV